MPKAALMLAAFAAAGTAAGIAYTAIALARLRAFQRRPAEAASGPPISVFKPLHGDEPQLYENLRSFCEQQYPRFQIIFGAAAPDDPALEHTRRLQRELPECDIAIVAGSTGSGVNPKIANVQGMWAQAKYDLLVIADSDIRVGPTYLQAIAAGFADENTGAVTCIYGGTPENTFSGALGAMHINDQFSPSVLVALALEPLTYCFGATMAVRRSVLERIGGLDALAGNLGDDYLLGNLVSDAGYRVHLSRYTVTTTVADRTLRALWLRELRWARTIYSARPAGYTGSIVTYPLPFAALLLATAPSFATFAVLAFTAWLRIALHAQSRKTLAPHTKPSLALIPLRDILGAAVWFSAFFGRRVHWRTGKFSVKAGGHMAAGDH